MAAGAKDLFQRHRRLLGQGQQGDRLAYDALSLQIPHGAAYHFLRLQAGDILVGSVYPERDGVAVGNIHTVV